MILVTHGIIGAAVGRLFPINPLLAFFVGMLSHFIFDAVPHWHYKIKSIEFNADSPKNVFAVNKRLVFDAFIIALDFLIGLWLAMLIFDRGDFSNYSVFAGVIGGVFPDGLTFLSLIWRTKILLLFQKFHHFVHGELNLNLRPILGPLSQIAIIAVVVFISKIILK